MERDLYMKARGRAAGNSLAFGDVGEVEVVRPKRLSAILHMQVDSMTGP
jgi:hypothetical protein